jgi:hypothetical protein
VEPWRIYKVDDARAFYQGLGFVSCGRLARQVKIEGQYDDEIVMEMSL